MFTYAVFLSGLVCGASYDPIPAAFQDLIESREMAITRLKSLGCQFAGSDKDVPEDLIYLGASVTDIDLVHLRAIPKIRRLSLHGAAITDKGLAILAELTQLETLNVSRTDITDSGLVHIGKISSLEGLRLDSTAVTDKGLTHLKGL